jgi:perosamine synthetase
MTSRLAGTTSQRDEALALMREMMSWTSVQERLSWAIPDPTRDYAWLPCSAERGSSLVGDTLTMELVGSTLQVEARASVTLQSHQHGKIEIAWQRGAGLPEGSFLREIAQALAVWVADHLGCTRAWVAVTSGSGSLSDQWHYDHSVDGDVQERILTAGPLIGPREVAYSSRATQEGWNAQHSLFTDLFEQEFAHYVGASFALSTSSCTGALHLALLALGIGPGDEVVVPATSWVATGSVVSYVGASPVFVDVDEMSWTLSPQAFREAVTPRTRAVIPVHLYGVPANMPTICDIASEHSIAVIEDAAPAVGATIGGKAVGSFGEMAAFSFQGAKLLVTGEGGMLVTRDEQLRERAWKQQDHGRRPGTFWIDEVGRKYKMSNQTAALGLAQLRSVETQILKKRTINDWYTEELGATGSISFQSERQGTRAIYWMTSIAFEHGAEQRDRVVEALRRHGVDTRPVFPPMSDFEVWTNVHGRSHEHRVADSLGKGAINLPSGVRLTRREVELVAAVIREAL